MILLLWLRLGMVLSELTGDNHTSSVNDTKQDDGAKLSNGLFHIFRNPRGVNFAFRTNYRCDIYPPDYRNAENITLLCGHRKLKDGDPLKVSFSCDVVTLWKNPGKWHCSVYVNPLKTEVETLELQVGQPETILITLHQSEGGEDIVVTQRSVTIRFFIKHTNINSDLYYHLLTFWNYITAFKNDYKHNPSSLEKLIKGVSSSNEPTTVTNIIDEKIDCLLSPLSARICDLEVVGNGRLNVPFDPDKALVSLDISGNTNEMPSSMTDLNLVINNSAVQDGTIRQISIYVDGIRYGLLPQTVDIGRLMKRSESTNEYAPIILRTHNEESGYESFIIVQFTKRAPRSKNLLIVSTEPGDAEFSKIEEMDSFGYINNLNITKGTLRTIIRRGMIKETRITLRAVQAPIIFIDIVDPSVEVTIDGMIVKTTCYKFILLKNNSKIDIKGSRFKKSIWLEYRNNSVYTFVDEIIRCLYICIHIILDGCLYFIDSLTSYKLFALPLDRQSEHIISDVIIRKLYLCSKDLETTRRLAISMLLDLFVLCATFLLGLLYILPRYCLLKFRRYLQKRTAIMAFLCNVISTLILIEYIGAFNNEEKHVHILGNLVPFVYFRYISLVCALVTSITAIRMSWRILRILVHSGDHRHSSSFSCKLGEMDPGDKGYHSFIEYGKIYKINFTKRYFTNYNNAIDDGAVEVEIEKIVSIPSDGCYGNTNITFRLCRTDLPGFDDTLFLIYVSLRNLELMSLMKRKIIVRCTTNSIDTSLRKCDGLLLGLYIGTTFCDLLIATLLMIAKAWTHSLLPVTLLLMLIKFTTILFATLARYSKLTTGNLQITKQRPDTFFSLCRRDILLLGLVEKCCRTLALTAYMITYKIDARSSRTYISSILKFWLFSATLNAMFPVPHVRQSLDFLKSIGGKLHLTWLYVKSLYNFLLFRWFKDSMRFIKWCMSERLRMYFVTFKLNCGKRTPRCMDITVLQFYILDRFGNVLALQSPLKVCKTLFIYPSVNIWLRDLLPSYYTPYGYQHLDRSSKTVKDITSNRSSNRKEEDCSSLKLSGHGHRRGGIESHYGKNMLDYDDQWINYNPALSDSSDSSITDPNENDVTAFVVKATKLAVDERLFGIVEWRTPMGWETKRHHYMLTKNVAAPYIKTKPLYLKVGSLRLVPSAGMPKVSTNVVYDIQKEILTIVTPMINVKELYTVTCFVDGKFNNDFTTKICHATCKSMGELIFQYDEYIDETTISRLIATGTNDQSKVYCSDITLTHDGHIRYATLKHPEFIPNEEYTITYEVAQYASGLYFVYNGPADNVFKEIRIPIAVKDDGYYEFVISDKTGLSHRIKPVNITLKDTYSFGMKSCIVNVFPKVDINYPGIGKALLTGNAFHYQSANDHKGNGSQASNYQCTLKTKNSQYILGDNMSFLVPITVISKVASFDGEERFRVIPHYNILAYDILHRITELKVALGFLESYFIASKKTNYDDSNAEDDIDPIEGSYSKMSYLSPNILLDGFYGESDAVPQSTFEQVMGALFSEETLQEFNKHLKSYQQNKTLFFASIQLVMKFCMDQLTEASEILLRQDDLTRDESLRLEMQKFDMLIGQGMMFEDAIDSLNNIDQFNYFVQFPFILKSSDIYPRVNIGQAVDSMIAEVTASYNAPSAMLFDHKCFIKEAITDQMLSYMPDISKGLCHIVIPNIEDTHLSINNEFGFIKAAYTNSESVATPIWVPCFITFNNGTMSLTPSDRVMARECSDKTIEILVTSVAYSISHDTIEVLGGIKVLDEQIQTVIRVVEDSYVDAGFMPEHSIIEDGSLTIRSHVHLLDIWNAISQAYPD